MGVGGWEFPRLPGGHCCALCNLFIAHKTFPGKGEGSGNFCENEIVSGIVFPK